ncbi:MAG: uncharacterized protein KVP18_001088 [Porospora cf. gigantea A]|uniref:uncharacterized protein n=1 Tax=Porospora cf. gigantea A TaxID=2853593 RepID=UPI0035593ACD|nr:MAG: hypothetical protein KVP18_001088 [Porospora cf. gigantea A]
MRCRHEEFIRASWPLLLLGQALLVSQSRPRVGRDEKLCERLAEILRHSAPKEGVDIRADGFVLVSTLLAKAPTTRSDLERIVRKNHKKRFGVIRGENGELLWIRARQGHSLPVDDNALFTPITKGTRCIHGTY